MFRPFLACTLILTVFASYGAGVSAEDAVMPFNDIIGTQAIGGRYHFTADAPLLESATRIAALGSGIMKFSISPQASFGREKANVIEPNANLKTLTDIAGKEPAHRAVLDMPFTHYLIWTYPFTTHGAAGQFHPGERELEYREVYDFACHLLRTYTGTGKRFYLGHWEGDWHLRPHFDPKQPFPDHYAENFIAWLRVRQQAIDDAKRDTPHKLVEVWHYTEVNLVRPFLKGGQCLTNDILPEVDVDYVSYSCYDSLQHDIHKDLIAALNHIESKMRPKPSISGKRVFIGEYGFPARRYSPDQQNEKSVETMITGLEWGCQFILYWELYDNEGTPEKPGGFWLINEKNEKQPIWETHRRFYEWARSWRSEIKKGVGSSPLADVYRQQAAKALEGMAKP